MTFDISSSPSSVQLGEDFEVDEELFDLKRFKDSQTASQVAFISPSQIDPLGEFSQVPDEVLHAEINDGVDDEEDDEDDLLIAGPAFTQPTQTKNDTSDTSDEEDLIVDSLKYESVPKFGEDGYIRYKIPEISGICDAREVLKLIGSAKKIVVISGAGISVSAGIPDFRSEGRGLYALLASFISGERSAEAVKIFGGLKDWQLEALLRLDEPESLFDLDFFLHDPHPFYAFLLATRFGAPKASRFAPTPSHHVLAAMPNLLLAFTQNIDTLEGAAGLAQVCYCHGSFESVSCVKCHRPHDPEFFWQLLEMYSESEIYDYGTSANRLPLCQYCLDQSDDSDDESDSFLPLLKPDIVFFGENLPANFFAHIRSTLPACDLLIVTGSSMKVLPVASIPDLIPPHIPQILINKDPILDHNFDLELLGEADCIWAWIGRELGYKGCAFGGVGSVEINCAGGGRFIFKK